MRKWNENESETIRHYFYRNLSFGKQLIHANGICKAYINVKPHKYLQLSWQGYGLCNRTTLLSVLLNSDNEEACISERNLYRVETAVLSV